MKNKINVILGTTASGKTKYSISLAAKLNGVVINCDSMQVYKEIPILTAQPTPDEKGDIEHRLFGYISCSEHYSVGRWLEDVVPVIKEVIERGKTPILVGGTGMYVKTLMDGISPTPSISIDTKKQVKSLSRDLLHKRLEKLDPVTSKKLKPNDHQRIIRALEVFIETGKSLSDWQSNEQPEIFFSKGQFYTIKIERPRETIYENIDKRFLDMVNDGVVDEVSRVYRQFGNIVYPKAHGLPEIISYLNGNITLDEAILLAQRNTRHYAKRQTTWMNHQVVFDKTINYR
jgi:tRNA dimethylallyltransferase